MCWNTIFVFLTSSVFLKANLDEIIIPQRPNLDQIITPQHAYIYIYISRRVRLTFCPFLCANGPPSQRSKWCPHVFPYFIVFLSRHPDFVSFCLLIGFVLGWPFSGVSLDLRLVPFFVFFSCLRPSTACSIIARPETAASIITLASSRSTWLCPSLEEAYAVWMGPRQAWPLDPAVCASDPVHCNTGS